MVFFLFTNCSKQNQYKKGLGAVVRTETDYVFTNGKVYTVDEKQPWVEAVAVKGNKIVFVGSSSDARAFTGKESKVVDLKGKMMLPGLVDAHQHIVAGPMAALVGVDLLGLETKDEIIEKLKKYAAENPGADLVRGGGWEKSLFGDEGPKKSELDEIFGNRPVVLFSEDRHYLWVSSKAYERAGVTNETPDVNPPISYYKKDKNNNLTGLVVENETTIPFAKALGYFDLKKAGARLTFGGDLPSAHVQYGLPLPSMKQAHTRRSAIAGPESASCAPSQEGYAIADLIKAYTVDGAYLMRLEDQVGSIEEGKLADLVILEKNILEVDPYQLPLVKVLLTMMNGELTHGDLSLEVADAESNIAFWLGQSAQ